MRTRGAMTARGQDSLHREAEALAVALRTLRWYGDSSNYEVDDWGVLSRIVPPDYGTPGGKARRALARIERMLEPKP